MSLDEKKALDIMRKAGGGEVRKASLTAVAHGFAALLEKERHLICLTDGPCAFADRLTLIRDEYRYGVRVRIAPSDHKNSQVLRLFLKWTAPRATEASSLGIEDDFGLLFPLFAGALAGSRIKPVLLFNLKAAQKLSKATGEAAWQAMEAGLTGGYGAEFSCARDEQEIMNALLFGYTGIVVDCRDKLKPLALNFSDEEAMREFAALPADFQEAVLSWYEDKGFILPGGKLSYQKTEVCRLTLCYGEAIAYLVYIYGAYFKSAPWPVDFSVQAGALDAKAHYFLAGELKRAGVRVAAVAADGPDFQENMAAAKALGHKLRIELTKENKAALALLNNETGAAFDLRPPEGVSFLWASEALGGDKPQEVINERREEYRRRALEYIARDKALLERLL